MFGKSSVTIECTGPFLRAIGRASPLLARLPAASPLWRRGYPLPAWGGGASGFLLLDLGLQNAHASVTVTFV